MSYSPVGYHRAVCDLINTSIGYQADSTPSRGTGVVREIGLSDEGDIVEDIDISIYHIVLEETVKGV